MPTHTTRDPATGEATFTYPLMTAEDVRDRIAAADLAFQDWKQTTFPQRALLMQRAAHLFEERADDLARLMAAEMGKPLAQGIAEAEKCATGCRFYAEKAEEFLADEAIPNKLGCAYRSYQPLGVILAVMPWNFPLWQVIRFAAPNLMAGNVGLLKHAANVPRCAKALEQLLLDAGFPSGVFTWLPVASDAVEAIIAHDLVRAVTLTGSVPAGRAVAAVAGKHLKKIVLELGGSDPYLILDDADVALAVEACTASRLTNSGQSCIAAKRFIVTPKVREAFETGLTAAMSAKRTGHPRSPDSDLGPLARHDLRDELHDQVQRSLASGATLLCGGEAPSSPDLKHGAYYLPTVLTNVTPGMAVFDEETFGPVAAIIPADSEEDAIRLANQSIFGLGAAVFTQDISRGEHIARTQLEAGTCVVNRHIISDPALPFGGIKQSGHGRELAAEGIREFMNLKTVMVE